MKTILKSVHPAIIVAAVAFVLCMTGITAMAADKFPSKTIDVVIHSKYGGGTDITARMMMIKA